MKVKLLLFFIVVTAALNLHNALAEPPQKTISVADIKAITEIQIVYAPCWLTCPIESLTLRSDGTATYSGAEDRKHVNRYRGTLFQPSAPGLFELPEDLQLQLDVHDTPSNSFRGLAELLLVNDFFNMKDKYGQGPNDGFYDGTNIFISAIRNGQRKEVSNSREDGSIVLWGIEQAILGVTRNIKWQKEAVPENMNLKDSGIRGIAMQSPLIGGPAKEGQPNQAPLPKAIITVQPATGGAEITRVVADKDGNFEIPLAPGQYLLVPLPPGPKSKWPHGATQTVAIKEDHYTPVVVEYDTGIR